ncbi:11566_t:CDS:2, partial [Diversispora eburnea]
KCESTSQIENQNLIIASQKNTNILQSSVYLELPVISRLEGGSQLSTSTIEIHSDKENSTGSKVPNQVQNVISSETDLDNITSATSNLSEIEQSSESAPSICTEPKSLEDKEIDEFLDSAYKEKAKTNKSLTPKYLEWHNKFTELSSIYSKLYKRYKKETGLDPWINSETFDLSQIEDTDNYPSQDCVIKIFKFPEEKSTIHEAVHKRFPFLSYTNSNAWHRDVFKYTNSEVKCPICKEIHTRYCIWGDWSDLGKDDHYYLNCSLRIDQKKVIIAIQNSLLKTQVAVLIKNRLYQYAIDHGIDPKEFLIITEAERNRKYHKFLTDRDKLVGEKLSRRGILKSGLSTAWLDELMEKWEKIHTQFTQIFGQNFDPFEKKTLHVPQVNIQSTPSKQPV